MSKVRLEFLSWIADTLGMEGTNEEIILESNIEENKTIRKLLNQLATLYPRFGQIVFDVDSQKLTDKAIIFLNGRHLELVNGLGTNLKDGDILTLVPPVAGG